MGCKWYVRGLSVPRVAALSALLSVAVGLTLPAAQSRAASTPAVTPLGRLTEADLMVIAPGSLTLGSTSVSTVPGAPSSSAMTSW